MTRSFRTAAPTALAPVLVLALGCATPDRASDAAGPEWLVFASGRGEQGGLFAVPADAPETPPVVVVDSKAPEGSARFDAIALRLLHHEYDDEGAWVVGDGTRFRCPNGDAAPVWAPDGSGIAYVGVRDGREDLWLAGRDGSGERRLTSDAEVDRYPAWSADSRRLVCARRFDAASGTPGWDLAAVDVATGAIERLTTRGEYVGHPSWSPDGSRVAFDTSFDDGTEICVLDLGSGEVTRLTQRPGNDLAPAWSGDGRTIAFSAEADGNWDVWTVPAAGGAPTRVTTDPAFDGGAVFVPAGVVGR